MRVIKERYKPEIGKNKNNFNPSKGGIEIPKPKLDFRFLTESKYCLKEEIGKIRDINNIKKFIADLQEFINKFSHCEDINKAIKLFSSHKNGEKVPKKIFTRITSQNLEKKDIVHLHLKANGNGKEILFGYRDSCGTFYVIGIDSQHTLF